MAHKPYKQKIEVHLERGHIYSLVGAATLIAAVVFCMGVWIGQRSTSKKTIQAFGKPGISELAQVCDRVQSAPVADDEDAVEGAPEVPVVEEIPNKPDGEGEFTLQLASFQSKPEAVAFYKEMVSSEWQAYLIHSKLPGRGVWYRVRLGAFDNYDAAIKAKKQFEKKQQVIAYVTRLAKP